MSPFGRDAFVALAAFGLAFGCARPPPPAAPPAIEVESDEVAAHRLIDLRPVRDGFSGGAVDRIPMRVTVAADGRIAATGIETNPRWGGRQFPASVRAKAESEVERWRYRPFHRQGAPVAVTFVETIALYPPEDRPARHVPMPAFDGSVRIRLERTACYGQCPDYSVEIAADGAVAFDGRQYVFVRGVRRARIDPAAARGLYDLARSADFFSLRDSYRAGVTDNPSYMVTIEAGGRRKRIVDYVGETVGMPSAVRALEDAIDAAAGTRRWVAGDDATVPALIAERYAFRSEEGARMLTAAAAAGQAHLVAQLIEAGAPLRSAAPAGSLGEPVAALPAAARAGNVRILALLLAMRDAWSRAELREALDAAAAGGRYEAFRLLAERGALAGVDRDGAAALLLGAARSGDPRLVALVLALRPDVNRIRPNYPDSTALAEAAKVTCPWNRAPPACDPPGVVALLLRAGADPRRVNPVSPSSPLTFVGDVRIARMLLAAGADPNFADFEGAPPIFSIYDEDVALVMIDAGADPRARRPADRMTVAGWARHQQWPRVLARLQQRGANRR